jgi:hypothetical protein
VPREILNTLLGYANTPLKACALALLIVVGVLSYVVFEQRREITQAVLQGYCPACSAKPPTDKAAP